MVFGIDADGVIVDLLTVWVTRYNVIYNDNLSIEEFAGAYDPHEVVKKKCGQKVYDILKVPGFFEDLPEIIGSINTIYELYKMGHQVNIITSYSDNAEIAKGKVLWFQKHVPIVMENKGLILCPARMKKYVKCDVFIDDYEKNVREHWWENSPTRIEPILVRAVHNEYSKWPNKIDRLSSVLQYLTNKGIKL